MIILYMYFTWKVINFSLKSILSFFFFATKLTENWLAHSFTQSSQFFFFFDYFLFLLHFFFSQSIGKVWNGIFFSAAGDFVESMKISWQNFNGKLFQIWAIRNSTGVRRMKGRGKILQKEISFQHFYFGMKMRLDKQIVIWQEKHR